MHLLDALAPGKVYRRIGGLENLRRSLMLYCRVYRRIGGLEIKPSRNLSAVRVYRRIGGLEIERLVNTP